MARRTKSNKWSRGLGALFAIAAITWGLGATAATLRSGSTPPQIGDDGSTGTLLTGSYDLGEDTGTGDNIIRLIDPAGCGNGGVSNQQCGSETDLCAMIYVFDDDQEMGECCGCPITPNELETFSVKYELTSNWGLAINDADSGIVQIVSGMKNNAGSCNPAHGCNGGCDPTIADVPSTSLIGSISRGQEISGTLGITEVPLQNDGPAETVESAYLPNQCASLIGNDTGAGVCTCAAPPTPTPTPIVVPPVVFFAQSGNSDNTDTGDVQITVAAGGKSAVLNTLVIVALDVTQVGGGTPLSSLVVTPPAASSGHPLWNLISSTATGSGAPSNPDMVQFLYWHMIGSGETSAAPSFSFSFGSDIFRATAVGINYGGTCTQDATPCSNPIAAMSSGTAFASNFISSGSAITVPANGIVLVAFGTTNTLDFFGESGSPPGTVSPPLSPENNNSGINAGLALYDQREISASTYGPFTATLPNGDLDDNVAQSISIKPE